MLRLGRPSQIPGAAGLRSDDEDRSFAPAVAAIGHRSAAALIPCDQASLERHYDDLDAAVRLKAGHQLLVRLRIVALLDRLRFARAMR